jgi:hypothetical protein
VDGRNRSTSWTFRHFRCGRNQFTAYNISLAKAKATGDPEVEKLANLLKTEYIDKGKSEEKQEKASINIPTPISQNQTF